MATSLKIDAASVKVVFLSPIFTLPFSPAAAGSGLRRRVASIFV